MKKLTKYFIPAADEVNRLQNCDTPECDFFQQVATQDPDINPGPTDTKQGMYAITPSGELLGSINNSRDAGRVAKMMRNALKKWKQMPLDKRIGEEAEAERSEKVHRPEDKYPEEGLVLNVFSRDLPREESMGDWRDDAWNRDFAWFKKEEARAFLPEDPEPDATHIVPEKLVHRLVQLHLVDNVRGQTRPYPDKAIKEAQLKTRVTSVEEGSVSIKMTGSTHTELHGEWSVCGYDDMNSPSKRSRGYRADLFGKATFDLEKEEFVSFELVAAGIRHGGTQYNGRCDDLDRAPMGHYFKLARDKSWSRVAPAFHWKYDW